MHDLSVDPHALDRFIERSKTKFDNRDYALRVLNSLLKTNKDGRHTFVCEGRLWTYIVRDKVVTTVFKRERMPSVDRKALRDGRKITPFIRMK